MSIPAFTFTSPDNLIINVSAAEQVQGGQSGLLFDFDVVQPDPANPIRIDLNGFFLDIGGDGGSLTNVAGSSANNMNGGNNDGYDYALALGSVGGSDPDFTDGQVFVPGLTLSDLTGSDAGLRATSYGDDGEGSLKLVDDYTPPPPPPDNHFPEFPQDISNVVLYFTDDNVTNDVAGTNGPDGFYLVKADEVPESASDDLDDWLGDVITHFENQGLIAPNTEFLGAAIKGGIQNTNFYAADGDPDSDPYPAGAPFATGTGNVPGNQIDYTLDYTDILIA
jgi:hypothetical protein